MKTWPVLILLAAQTAIYLGFAAEAVEPAFYLRLHLGLCAAAALAGAGWAATAPAGAGQDRLAAVAQLVAWTALAGPFGTLIAAALAVPRADAAAAPPPAPPATAAPERLHRALRDGRLRLDGAHAVRPLLDVVGGGTRAEKFDALGLIARRFAPSAAPALGRALEDGDAAVRVLAATVMAQQHAAFTRRIGACQEAARAAPADPLAWQALAQAHLDYARSGLLDGARADDELARARAAGEGGAPPDAP